jgi:hypothetical protein
LKMSTIQTTLADPGHHTDPVPVEHLTEPESNGHPDVLPIAPRGEASAPTSDPPAADFPAPRALTIHEEFVWDEDQPQVETYAAFGAELASSDDLFRVSAHASGLMLAASSPNIPPTPINKGNRLKPIIVDRLRVKVIKGGNSRGGQIPTAHLNTLLASEAFLQRFRPIDFVSKTALYLPDFRLTQPGYNDGGLGHRIYFCGDEPLIVPTHETIDRFLDVMQFASPADRTNAVAAALNVMLRNHFPGAKPMISVTANKSHAGKGTIIDFATGNNRATQLSYEETDWSLQRNFIGALNHNPDTAVINIDNARLGNRSQFIRSAFIERFLTDPEPTLFSTGTGAPRRMKNDVVVAMTTNFGSLSEDLANRALPIHLEAIGNIANRESAIGNPKLEFLPANRDQIEAELRGMIANWKEAGCPLDCTVRHPFSQWAATIGGILRVNGFSDFLANYAIRRTTDDPIRHALGLLGVTRPDQWLTAAAWAELAKKNGLDQILLTTPNRHNDKSRARGVGVLLTACREETYQAETDDERLTLRLEKARCRFDGASPTTRYRFVTVQRTPIPVDDADQQAEVPSQVAPAPAGESAPQPRKQKGRRNPTQNPRSATLA